MTKRRPFRFGVLGEHLGSRDDLLETARRAEANGYATFLIRDHFVAEPFGHQLAPLAALATVASVTSTLRVGTLVLDNDYRHPVVLAKEAATIDLLSGGRFELGMGAGWLRTEYEQAGLAFDQAGVRVARFAEAVQVLKGLFADEPLTFSGRYYTITDLDSYPKPVQRPHPSILVGAGGRRMLSIAAREADIIGVLPASVASGSISTDPTERSAANVARKVAWVRQAAGERFGENELGMAISVVVADDHRQAAEWVAREQGWDVTPEQVLEMPSVLIGSVGRIAEELQERRERYGFSYYVVSDHDLAAFASVVARLAGR